MSRLRIHARRHDARRDTHWVGKGVGGPLLYIALLMVAAAIGIALLMG